MKWDTSEATAHLLHMVANFIAVNAYEKQIPAVLYCCFKHISSEKYFKDALKHFNWSDEQIKDELRYYLSELDKIRNR